jgi:hypothetical protein
MNYDRTFCGTSTLLLNVTNFWKASDGNREYKREYYQSQRISPKAVFSVTEVIMSV